MAENYCIISHTHWDREWYLPLENFKLRLADLFDNLLDILDHDDGYRFHLDAQTIVLEDYLEYKPWQRKKLEKYVQNGQLLVGPWYVQNDFFLTSGEATVRNLIIGSAIAEEFGKNMPIGYAADQFGLIDQLPQILNGFGLDNCIFGRGYWFAEPKPLEFYWQTEDGSSVLCEHMAFWYNNAQRFSENTDESLNMLHNIVHHMSSRVLTSNYLLMNGVDHLEAQENLTPIIKNMSEKLPENENVFQDTMPEFIERVKREIKANGIKPETFTGELRNGGAGGVLTGTLSSRVDLKMLNAESQHLLEKKFEPIWFGASMLGLCEFPLGYDTYLWKLLIQNHPHDSICGCSVDAVHKHMTDRFERVLESATDLVTRGADELVCHIDRAGLDGTQQIITVFNPTQADWSGAVETVVRIPLSEDKGSIGITVDGKSAEFTVNSRTVKEIRILSPINLPGSQTVAEYNVTLSLGNVYGMSHKSAVVTPVSDALIPGVNTFGSANRFENEFMSVTINKNGTADITEKKTGACYRGLFLLEDICDHGTAYNFTPYGKPVTSSGASADIGIITENEFVSSRRIRYTFEFERDGRKAVDADITLTLKRGVPYLMADVTVDNSFFDHRLRVLFPTGIASDRNFAGVPYNVITRNKISIFNDDREHPNTDFVGIEDGQRGFAVFNTGLYEYEQIDDNDNTLALTLVRSTGRITGGWEGRNEMEQCWLTSDSQMQGKRTLKLAVYPFAQDRTSANVAALAAQFNALPFAVAKPVDINKFIGGRPFVQGPGMPGLYYRPLNHADTVLSHEMRYVKLDESVPGAMLFSALKGGEDGKSFVIRLFNTTDKPVMFSVEFARELSSAKLARMDETELSELKVEGRAVKNIAAKPKEIITVKVI